MLKETEIYKDSYSINDNVISAQNGYGGQRRKWLIQFLKSKERKCYISTSKLGPKGEARVFFLFSVRKYLDPSRRAQTL